MGYFIFPPESAGTKKMKRFLPFLLEKIRF